MERYYPIGTPGQPWTEVEDQEWKATTKRQRSYQEEVLNKLIPFENHAQFELVQYGALSHDVERYPLMAVQSRQWDDSRPSILVTGGVHGYETSGVQGAILFLTSTSLLLPTKYMDKINVLVIPCVSPWSYEHIQRWQADLKDPNRSFVVDSTTNDNNNDNKNDTEDSAGPKQARTTEESQALMDYVKQHFSTTTWTCHVDLHETTNSDATEFMPAKHAKAGLPYDGEVIPDGFYLVGNDQNPTLDFHSSVIESVKQVTHIAPPDQHGTILDIPIAREGVILVPVKQLGLCCGMTDATFVTTTEVYPDSSLHVVTDEICNQAQVAAIEGAIDHVLKVSAESKS